MNEILSQSVFFGIVITLVCYEIGRFLAKKLKNPIINPLLIAAVLIIVFLLVFKVDYNTYAKGADFISMFLTPVTVCLAVPLYRQIEKLKENLWAVLISILCGCIAHVLTIVGISMVLQIDEVLMTSVLPKSVTTAIALGVSSEVGGIGAVTIIGVMIAGVFGATLGPLTLKLGRIKEPVARGLAVGSASHAVGTSKMLEEGEIQGAMSSLAIVVTGILTVIIVPIVYEFLTK